MPIFGSGEYHRSVCNCVLEVFDGSKLIAYRSSTQRSGLFMRRLIAVQAK
jgi:hypothetical protein